MFDIAKIAVASTAALHLKDASGNLLYTVDNKPVRIILYGPASPEYARIEDRATQRALKRATDNDGKPAPASTDERREQIAEDYASITVAFENFNYSPAGDVSGAEAFRAVYAEPKLGFIVNQITKFLGDWGNFKPASGAN